MMTKKSKRLWKEAITEARKKIYEVEKEKKERKERHRRLMEFLLIPEDF
jgi:hypothetical protein